MRPKRELVYTTDASKKKNHFGSYALGYSVHEWRSGLGIQEVALAKHGEEDFLVILLLQSRYLLGSGARTGYVLELVAYAG